MTVYCYDTEFLEDGSTIELISIGIVCEDGREYYAVNSEMDVDRIKRSDWLMANVWPHLPLRGRRDSAYPASRSDGYLDRSSTLVKPKWVIANEVREFIVGAIADRDEAVPEDELPELWAYYGAYDHIALMQLWGQMINHPRFMPMWTHDLMQLIEPLAGFDKPAQSGDEHNALADARWNYSVLCAARRYAAAQVDGLAPIREAHNEYQAALARREHGAVAADHFIRTVEEHLERNA
ncbi:3'-5' exoribonuclease [Mycolicibacterium llatzerense]|uniref:3'-5' exoribonuclease n=1 Tax=Mycolicibacterium llatzerense TaxID=280871 RepID=UPI0021B6D68F|nr:3'-5' exoribonuclease [Mycolicibacterium llatzerense]MCT7369431.1 hypothetical protein [Mycolicibacterium llatzerense]